MADRECQLEIGAKAMEGLLGEFREGNFGRWDVEKEKLLRHLGEISSRWEERFPGLPEGQFPYSSFKGVSRRGVRDEYLKGIIVKALEGIEGEGKKIFNPASVWGRHARDVARRLPGWKVIATDINPRFERFYKRLPWSRTPSNYEFIKGDIFSPKAVPDPTAVVFFGACGSLTDAAMDYAIESHAPLLICRTCCHDNIGGNTEVVKRFGLLNWAFRMKNSIYLAKKCRKKTGEYFSNKYSADHYPTSQAARKLSNPDEFIEIARNTVDSDICRSIIDLDRYLHLVEAGYDVWYRAEMFVAEIATTAQRHEETPGVD